MSKADFSEDLPAIFQPIAGSLKIDEKWLVSGDNAAEIEQLRQSLANLATSVRAIDDGATAFQDCFLSSLENGASDSAFPGYTPFGPVEDSKRKSTASNSKVNAAPLVIKKKRDNYPKETTEVLKQWLFDHLSDPYPSEAERDELGARLGLVSSCAPPLPCTTPSPTLTEQNSSSQLVRQCSPPLC